MNFTRASRGIRSFCAPRSIDTFIEYFGVCSKNSPVLPDKITHREKNVSRETFTMRPRLCDPVALWISNSFLSWLGLLGRRRNNIWFAVAGEATSRYGACLCARPVKYGHNRRYCQIPVISSLPSIHTVQNNKLKIAGFTGYICFSMTSQVPHCNPLRPSCSNNATLLHL